MRASSNALLLDTSRLFAFQSCLRNLHAAALTQRAAAMDHATCCETYECLASAQASATTGDPRREASASDPQTSLAHRPRQRADWLCEKTFRRSAGDF